METRQILLVDDDSRIFYYTETLIPIHGYLIGIIEYDTFIHEWNVAFGKVESDGPNKYASFIELEEKQAVFSIFHKSEEPAWCLLGYEGEIDRSTLIQSQITD